LMRKCVYSLSSTALFLVFAFKLLGAVNILAVSQPERPTILSASCVVCCRMSTLIAAQFIVIFRWLFKICGPLYHWKGGWMLILWICNIFWLHFIWVCTFVLDLRSLVKQSQYTSTVLPSLEVFHIGI
jgi:hypothetical protein